MKNNEKRAILENIKDTMKEYNKAIQKKDTEKILFLGGYVVGLADLCQQLGIKIK